MAQEGRKARGPTFDKELAESLIDLEVPKSLKFSPDGQKVVYSAGRAGNVHNGKNFVSSLWLASAGVPGSARQLTSGSFSDSAATWHPDGNRIFFRSDRAEAGTKYGVWVLRLDGGDATAITPTDVEQNIQEKKEENKSDESKTDVWGEKWEYGRLRLVDVETKETRLLVSRDRHITDLNWSQDGKNIVFRSNKNTELEEPDISGGTISTVNVESGIVKDVCTVRAQFFDLIWAPDGKVYFIEITPVESLFGGYAVFTVDPAEESPSFVRAAYGEQDDAGEVLVISGRIIAKREARLGSIVSEVGKDDLFSFSDTDIGDYDVFFDRKPALSDHGKAFKDRSFGTYKVLKCQPADGEVELDGICFAPESKTDADGKPKEPLPTLVSIHGGPSSSDSISWDTGGRYWSAYALSQGYGVLLPQYRGSSGRSEKFSAYSGLGVGKYDYSDVITITDHAVKQGFANPKRLMVGGWSQGGYLAYLCSVRNGLHGLGWKFQAGIPGAGIMDWDSLCITSRTGASFQAQMTGGGRAP
ncbi:WD40/YVTN repeat-like-containing domain protein [Akanthomyces lecanii RCEF 1005]|uniref:Dipeptidyl-peptidase V n=1 Tax=Akanthomyces lecanii RCEF 1005 TaxID=1081108 RepID=A0A168L2Y2_CORDF|nr:WD40/YVTN repeat-like-containing domain protein [Akanthomyces lecanii RCEF 1005]